jgi:hypothetical protein
MVRLQCYLFVLTMALFGGGTNSGRAEKRNMLRILTDLL